MPTRPGRFVGAARRESAAATAFAGFIALAVAMGIGRFAFTPILPMMQEEGGLSIADGGWLACANYIGYLLGALIAVGMRIQPAAAIRYGLVVIGLVTLGMGIDHRFAVWIVLRGLAGIASAWVLIFVSAWCLEKLAPFGRPILNSIVFSGVGSGIAVAGGLCLAVMHANLGAAEAWITLGILSLAAAAAIWRVFQPQEDASYQDASAPADALRWDSESVRLVLCYGAFGFGYIIPATFLPVMAKQVVHDPAVFGWSWPAFGIAALVSTLAASILRKFIGSRL